MKYYLHDVNSFNDEKITMLFIKYGYEGVGLFYTILEKLAQQEKPVLTDVLKHQLKVGKKLSKIWKYLEEIDLISSNNGETFNKQLLNFSEKYQVKKEKNKKRIAEWREKQRDSESVTRNVQVRNTSKVKESKVKESKVKRNIPKFSEFMEYAKTREPLISETHLRSKYDAWVENGWKNGYDKDIKNWKSALINTIKFIDTVSVIEANKNINDGQKRKEYLFDGDQQWRSLTEKERDEFSIKNQCKVKLEREIWRAKNEN